MNINLSPRLIDKSDFVSGRIQGRADRAFAPNNLPQIMTMYETALAQFAIAPHNVELAKLVDELSGRLAGYFGMNLP